MGVSSAALVNVASEASASTRCYALVLSDMRLYSFRLRHPVPVRVASPSRRAVA